MKAGAENGMPGKMKAEAHGAHGASQRTEREAPRFDDTARPLTPSRLDALDEGLDLIGASAGSIFRVRRVLQQVCIFMPAPHGGLAAIELLPAERRRGLAGGVALNWYVAEWIAGLPVLDAPDSVRRPVRLEVSGDGTVAALIGNGTVWAHKGSGEGAATEIPEVVFERLREVLWRARYGRVGAWIAAALWRAPR